DPLSQDLQDRIRGQGNFQKTLTRTDAPPRFFDGENMILSENILRKMKISQLSPYHGKVIYFYTCFREVLGMMFNTHPLKVRESRAWINILGICDSV
ncbi:MAG: hypothetical protein KAX31_01525, partial [Thermoplasmata archaeon]|nr:hypothetical protein [Thermoplasmata archaeon]